MRKQLLLFLFFCAGFVRSYAEEGVLRISTDATDLILRVASNGRLYQSYLGPRLLNESDMQHFPAFSRGGSGSRIAEQGWETYPASGMEDYFEPALGIIHQDGNMTTLLKYVSSETRKIDENVSETSIILRDDVYPIEVKLYYRTFKKENIIKTWTEIRHQEKKPVTLFRYASAMLYFESPHYYLTEFSGDWAKEVVMNAQELLFGKKVLDTKLGSRAAMHTSPFFQLGFGQPIAENQGNVLLGTLGWTGNFRFTFEVDNEGNLRIISGINPYASPYELKPGEIFKTPEFIFTLSEKGRGEASRNFHDWARRYQVKDGEKDRLTLLNNW